MKTQLNKGGNVVLEVSTPMIYEHAHIVKYGNDFYYFNTVQRTADGEIVNCYEYTDQVWNLQPQSKTRVID